MRRGRGWKRASTRSEGSSVEREREGECWWSGDDAGSFVEEEEKAVSTVEGSSWALTCDAVSSGLDSIRP